MICPDPVADIPELGTGSHRCSGDKTEHLGTRAVGLCSSGTHTSRSVGPGMPSCSPASGGTACRRSVPGTRSRRASLGGWVDYRLTAGTSNKPVPGQNTMADGKSPRDDEGLGPASHTRSISLSWMGQQASDRHFRAGCYEAETVPTGS